MILPIVCDLGSTATYLERSAAMVFSVNGLVRYDRVSRGGEVEPVLVPAIGKLTIKLVKQYDTYRQLPTIRPGDAPVYERMEWGKEEIDTYAVCDGEPVFPGCDAVMLLNLTDPEQEEPYLVHLGGMDLCRCMAGRCKVKSIRGCGCKHRDALKAVIAVMEAAGIDPADAGFRTRKPLRAA